MHQYFLGHECHMPLLFPLFILCCFNKHAVGQCVHIFQRNALASGKIELGLPNVLFNDDCEGDLSPESDSDESSDSEKTG
jgi:hypothetical protein